MKVIISPPRVASTFYAHYWQQNNPQYIMQVEKFQNANHTAISKQEVFFKKIQKLHNYTNNNYLIKILTTKNVDKEIYRYLINHQIPITFIYRRDFESQVLSASLMYATRLVNAFPTYNWVLHPNRPTQGGKSVLIKPTTYLKRENLYKNLIFQKEAAIIVRNAIRRCKVIEKHCNVSEVLYYEDIIKYPYKENSKMPLRIHNMTKEEIYDCFVNANEAKEWIEKYKIE